MKLIIVTGMPAAGKNVAAQYAESRGYPYFSTGDVVRAEIGRRKLTAGPETSAAVSTELRGADGLGVTKLAVQEALKQDADRVFLEGIRSWAEVEWIRAHADCLLVAVVAPRELRLERIINRGRADDSASHFDARDQREIEYGVAVCVALADAYILNTTTFDDACEQLNRLVQAF